MFKSFTFCVVLFWTSFATAAISIDIGTEVDSDSSLLSFDGVYYGQPGSEEEGEDLGGDKDKDSSSIFLDSVSAGFTGSRSEDKEATENPILNTRSARVGLSVGLQKAIISIGGSSSRTQEIAYESRDGYVSLGYPITDWFYLEVEGGGGRFAQDFSYTVLSKTYYKTFELEQKSGAIAARFSFLDSWSASIRVTSFEYDRSDADIRKAIDSPFLNRQASALVSSFASLLKSGSEFSLGYILSDNVDFEVRSYRDIRLYDDGIITSWRFSGAYTTESLYIFRLGLSQVKQDKETRSVLASLSVPL